MEKISASAGVESAAAATLSSLLDNMDGSAVDKSVVLQVVTKEAQQESALLYAKAIDSQKIVSFGSVLPTSERALEYIWKISDEGLKGMKLHPALQRFDLGDERYFPLFDLARACGLIVLIHMGFDPTYPGELNSPPQALVSIMKNFPGLKVVAAHLGGLRMAREVLDTLAGREEIYLDTAYCADPWLDRGLFKDIIRRHGADKVLFGSDFPWHLPRQELELIRSLDISVEEKRLILGENARRLLES